MLLSAKRHQRLDSISILAVEKPRHVDDSPCDLFCANCEKLPDLCAQPSVNFMSSIASQRGKTSVRITCQLFYLANIWLCIILYMCICMANLIQWQRQRELLHSNMNNKYERMNLFICAHCLRDAFAVISHVCRFSLWLNFNDLQFYGFE